MLCQTSLPKMVLFIFVYAYGVYIGVGQNNPNT